jgi:hypothetical protein
VTPAGPAARPAGSRALAGLWLAGFAYAATAAWLVQLVLLPRLVPAWHAGHGLVAGSDSVSYHRMAARHAAEIRARGWSAFVLRPDGHTMVGLTSAVYALTVSEPWTMIPLNAAAHATGGVALASVVRLLVPGTAPAAVAALPFLLYPSALAWVAQLLKDGYFAAGWLCLLAGLAGLARDALGVPAGGAVARRAALLAGAVALVWVSRPDQVRVLQAVAAGGAVLVTAAVGVRAVRPLARRGRAMAAVGLAWLTALGPGLLPETGERIWAADPARTGRRAGAPGLQEPGAPDPVGQQRAVRATPWYRTPWLPTAADRMAYGLALVREQFLVFYREAGSNLDVDVSFHRAADVVRYAPRALAIALWAPFPGQWAAAAAHTPGGTAMRRVVALEMVGVYLAMAPLAALAWQARRRLELWVVLLGCLAPLTLYAAAIPNLGALHRFRYASLMTLVGLGVAAAVAAWRHRRPRDARPPARAVLS